jgi:hypothetical protein
MSGGNNRVIPSIADRVSAMSRADVSGCVLWSGYARGRGDNPRNHYGTIRIDGRVHFAHRVVWELANGPIPEGVCVCHHCDTPRCVLLDHLFLGTHQDNKTDCVVKGRARGGRVGGKKKLSSEDVRAIREAAAAGVALKDLAAGYGVTYGNMWSVVRGLTWREA